MKTKISVSNLNKKQNYFLEYFHSYFKSYLNKDVIIKKRENC